MKECDWEKCIEEVKSRLENQNTDMKINTNNNLTSDEELEMKLFTSDGNCTDLKI